MRRSVRRLWVDLSIDQLDDAVGALGDGVVVADDDHGHAVSLAHGVQQVERSFAAG